MAKSFDDLFDKIEEAEKQRLKQEQEFIIKNNQEKDELNIKVKAFELAMIQPAMTNLNNSCIKKSYSFERSQAIQVGSFRMEYTITIHSVSLTILFQIDARNIKVTIYSTNGNYKQRDIQTYSLDVTNSKTEFQNKILEGIEKVLENKTTK